MQFKDEYLFILFKNSIKYDRKLFEVALSAKKFYINKSYIQ